ncbi:Baeyer-Villiger monooxygenase [Trichoderma asperellum]|uniref:Baeyer-Villiger monooxygenase n=1 Tax=Trichoderma asperellum TaxID=101201 RepID=A0A6V8QKR8_TRIAP|nr:Baeyer-Villiger monooxygenase [Trichoderma asperellum]
MSEKATYSQFACIGTGFSGIALGCTIKRWYGITDIRLFEKKSDLGGTWLANQYPGCACDVPSLLYSFSFAPNPKWSKILPSHQEVWQYLDDVATQYGLREKMSFNSCVERCEWIEQSGRWRLTGRNTISDTSFVHECQFLFSGSGLLVYPRKPDLPNIENFDGPVFHAAEWRHDVDLTNKKVALIGNGCSASQIVPNIKDQVEHVTQFVRTKHWIIPPVQVPNVKLFQWMFMHIPGFLKFTRFLFFVILENEMRGFYMTKAAAAVRRSNTAEAVRYIKKKAPEKYYDKLIPDFEMGCKRRIYDPNYLTSLHSENVTLRDDAIEEVTPRGIRSKDGYTDIDVIVFASGYETNSFCTNIDIVGRQGMTAEEHWKSLGGPGAYNTTSLSGFPNLFLILGHTSTIMAVENSINYALRLIKPILQGKAMAIDVSLDAEKRYIDQIQTDLQQTVWLSGRCNNWYNRAQDGSRHNGMSYPYSQPYFWYRCLFPIYKDFQYDPPKNKSPPRGNIWRETVRYSILAAASLSGLSLILSSTKSGWDLPRSVEFLKAQVGVLQNSLVEYIKL